MFKSAGRRTFINRVMEYIIQNFDQFILIAGAGIGFFSAIATMTPNEHDNKIAAILLNIINILGANFGKAKNKK